MYSHISTVSANSVKISTVDVEIICLREITKKTNKYLKNISKNISPARLLACSSRRVGGLMGVVSGGGLLGAQPPAPKPLIMDNILP